MTVVGTAIIDFIANTANFNSDVKKSAAALQTETAKMSSSLQSIEVRMDQAAAATKAYFAGEIIGDIAKLGARALEFAGNIGKVAAQVGVSTDVLQTYRYAAVQTGAAQEDLDNSLSNLTDKLGQAQLGSKSAASLFSSLGVSVTDANGKFRSTNQVLPEIVAALGKIPDPARRAALEIQLFGQSGQKLDGLFSGGTASVDQFTEAARELGVVISSGDIQKTEQATIKLTALKAVLEAKIAGAVADNIDTITRMTGALSYLAEVGGKALRVIGDFSNRRNVRGLFLAGDQSAGTNLLSSDSGRQALLNETDRRLQANMRASASGQGDQAALDREFRALNRIRNTTLSVDRRSRIKAPVGTNSPTLNLRGSGRSGGGRTGGGSSRADASAAQEAAAAERELAQALDQIVGKFDPAQKAALDYANTLATIDKAISAGKLSGSDALDLKLEASRQASEKQAADQKAHLKDMLGYDLGGKDAPGEKLFDAWREQEDNQRKFTEEAKDNAYTFRASWEDAAQGTLRSLDQLSYGIQSGGFLDIISGVISLLEQLGSLGVFGSKIQTNIKGARASGGPVMAGGAYLVGEKGPELFTPTSSGHIIANDNLSAMATNEGSRLTASSNVRAQQMMATMQPIARVEVVPSPYFDAVTRGNAAQVAAPMATQAGMAGASLAETRIRRKSANRLP